MSILDTRIYRWLETATAFFLLNLLWLVACLPVVTIFPSTAAMFGVVRDWVRGKDGSLTRTFITRFRENLGLSLLLGRDHIEVGTGARIHRVCFRVRLSVPRDGPLRD